MSNKIKEFKEKHPKVFNGIIIGGSIAAAGAAFFIGKKIGGKLYEYDAGWYVKDLGDALEPIMFDDQSKFSGYGLVHAGTRPKDWLIFNDHLAKSEYVSLTDVKDLITKIIDDKIAAPDAETVFLLMPDVDKK